MEQYFQSQRSQIFKNVGVLIYVFEVTSKDEDAKKDMEYYISCRQALEELSKDAKIFCLVHKMDLIPEQKREEVF